ncbi:MAG: tRNA-intron lyase [Candidatus Terraquivivens tikiterensis]|uniref:tRNA-intron lyase n=1 Tax=Candidatus Terraquivivens tikiterensis TaxID=1980982 RepID=A0A2R7Y9B7_9ARCH|nr:MAG: tRNA-intron lyase [Candidatus Terraquivivens tikiterensis]
MQYIRKDGLGMGPEEVPPKLELRFDGEKIYAEVSERSLALLSKGYGQLDKESGIIVYNAVEALYLLENKMASVLSGSSNMTFNELLRALEGKSETLWRDYVIYRDLRNRRYTVKEGFSRELTFRVFERGEFQKEAAKYLIAPLSEGKSVKLSKIKHLLSICRSLKKDMVISVVDRRNEVVYYLASQVDLKNV